MNMKDREIIENFARWAVQHGWNNASLESFCIAQNISQSEALKRWPSRVRSLSHDFNALADLKTRERFECQKAENMSEIFLSRFEQNQNHKQSVVRLAVSDFWHPIDTIKRTATTISIMDKSHMRNERSRLKRGALVVVYSICVLIWFVDFTKSKRLLKLSISALLVLIGER